MFILDDNPYVVSYKNIELRFRDMDDVRNHHFALSRYLNKKLLIDNVQKVICPGLIILKMMKTYMNKTRKMHFEEIWYVTAVIVSYAKKGKQC